MARQRTRTHRRPSIGQRAGTVPGIYTPASVEWQGVGGIAFVPVISGPVELGGEQTFIDPGANGWTSGEVRDLTGVYYQVGAVKTPITAVEWTSGAYLYLLVPGLMWVPNMQLIIPPFTDALGMAGGVQCGPVISHVVDAT